MSATEDGARPEPPILVLAVGLLTLLLLTSSLIWVMLLGWPLSLGFGVLLLALARYVPAADDLRVIRWIVGSYGALAVAGAVAMVVV